MEHFIRQVVDCINDLTTCKTFCDEHVNFWVDKTIELLTITMRQDLSEQARNSLLNSVFWSYHTAYGVMYANDDIDSEQIMSSSVFIGFCSLLDKLENLKGP
jgi:hypothetical protein